jgi:hypothetical protein
MTDTIYTRKNEVCEQFLTAGNGLRALSTYNGDLQEFLFGREILHLDGDNDDDDYDEDGDNDDDDYDEDYDEAGRGALALKKYYQKSATALVAMLRRCSKLKKVSLTGDVLFCVNLDNLVPLGHLLHELDFLHDDENPTPVTGRALSDLLTRCGNLVKFHYSSRSSFRLGPADDEERDRLVLTALLPSCPLLEELELVSLSLVAAEAFFTGLGRTRTQIRKMRLHCCRLSESILRSIAGVETLKDLDLDCCQGLTDAGVAALGVLKLTRLSILDTWGDIVTFGGSGLTRSLTPAAFVSLTGAGADVSRTLEALCIRIEATPVVDADQLASAVASCPLLKTLSIGWGHDRDRAEDRMFGLEGLQAIVAGCPLLTDVSLRLDRLRCEYPATHCLDLKKCIPSSFLPDAAMRGKYPNIKWSHFC